MGTGLAFYVALIEHLLGDDLTFVVLDDVIRHIDIAHRRKICDLLRHRFPNVHVAAIREVGQRRGGARRIGGRSPA